MLTLLMAVAGAQTLGQLPYGTHADLSTCFDEGGSPCARAATYLGSPWSAPLTAWATNSRAPKPGADLSADAALQQALLSCILTSDQCEDAAARLDAPATRMEATFLHLEACREGKGTACDDLGVPSLTRQGGIGLTAQQQENWRIAPGFVPPTEVLDTLIQTCDGTDAPAAHDACLTLASLGNGLRGKPERHEQFMNTMRIACMDGSPSSCSIVSAWDEPNVPTIQALSTTFPLLRNLCDTGQAGVACEAAARSLELGRPVAPGTHESVRYHGYACDSNVKPGCKQLDRIYKAPSMADEVTRECDSVKAGTGGDPRACTSVYAQLKFGVGRPKDEAAASVLYERLCELGDPRVCLWQANKALNNDTSLYIDLNQKACDLDFPVACTVAGRSLVWPTTGTADLSKGRANLKKGCESLNAGACFSLGEMDYEAGAKLFANGSSATQQMADAYASFDRSCALGELAACSYLGGMKVYEQGTTNDAEGGLWLLNLACSAGVADACRVIGDAYNQGLMKPHPKDPERARYAYQQACDLKLDIACSRLDELGDGAATPPHEGVRPATTSPTTAASKASRSIVVGSYTASYDVQQAVREVEEEEITIRKRPHPTVQGFLVRDLGASGLGHDGSFGVQISHGFKGFGWGLQFLREDWSFGAIDTLELTVDRGLFYKSFANYKLSFGASAYASAGYVMGDDNSFGASVGAEVSLGVRINNPLSFALFWRPVKPFSYGAGTNNELYLQAVRQDIGLSYTF